MFLDAVPEGLKHNLESLGQKSFIRPFWLGGGTAIALKLGHRISRDLDFFTPESFKVEELRAEVSKVGEFAEDMFTEDTIIGRLNGVRIAFFLYRYPLLFPLETVVGVTLADIRDLACMKVDAVQHRGRKRDFVDLWAIVEKGGIPLIEILQFFDRKFEGVAFNRTHILKSLIYFDDAEQDPMPDMRVQVSWSEIKEFFERETMKLAWG